MAKSGRKPTSKREQIYDDEWFQVADPKNFQLECCDCGLVHDIKWKIKGKKLIMLMNRNKKETEKVRKESK